MIPTKPNPNWPRLSVSLTGPRDRHHCQHCGAPNRTAPISSRWPDEMFDSTTGWVEHDHNDQPEPIVVFLCKECAEWLIGSHVRLYRQLRRHEPFPGAMPLCDDCRFRDGVSCKNRAAKINGGPGLNLTFPRPTQAMVDGADARGRRCGWHEVLYGGPVSACSGKEKI